MTNNQAIAALAALLQQNQPQPKTRKAKGQRKVKLTDEQKTVNAKANAAAAVKVFEDAGYKNCVAHETIKTYDGWTKVGRKVKTGQTALRVPKGYALFHLDQTEEIVKSN